jgi:hypothetical protein
VAVVLLQQGAHVTDEAGLLAAVNAELGRAGLAELAALRVARTGAEFPLGPTGKVLKRELRTRHAGLLTGPAASTAAAPTAPRAS